MLCFVTKDRHHKPPKDIEVKEERMYKLHVDDLLLVPRTVMRLVLDIPRRTTDAPFSDLRSLTGSLDGKVVVTEVRGGPRTQR